MTQLPGCLVLASVLLGLLTGCATQNLDTPAANSSSQPPLVNRPGLRAIAPDALPPLRQGQVIYVPIYSEVYDFNQAQTFQITATLSLRNPD